MNMVGDKIDKCGKVKNGTQNSSIKYGKLIWWCKPNCGQNKHLAKPDEYFALFDANTSSSKHLYVIGLQLTWSKLGFY